MAKKDALLAYWGNIAKQQIGFAKASHDPADDYSNSASLKNPGIAEAIAQKDAAAVAARQAAAQSAQQANVVPVATLRAPKATDVPAQWVSLNPLTQAKNNFNEIGLQVKALLGDKTAKQQLSQISQARQVYAHNQPQQAAQSLGGAIGLGAANDFGAGHIIQALTGDSGYQSLINTAQQAHPIASTIGSLAGYVGPGAWVDAGIAKAAAPVLAKLGTSVAGRVASSALTGAASNALLSGVSDKLQGRSNADTLKDVGMNAAVGGVLGGAGTALTSIPWVTDRMASVDSALQKAKIKAAPEEAAGGVNDTAAQVAADSMPKSARTIVENSTPDAFLSQNRGTLAQDEPVAKLTGAEFPKSQTSLVDQVGAYYDSIGNHVSNPLIGDVTIDRRGVKDSIAHGLGRDKAIAFKAVPEVLQDGKIIDYQQNWKGRGYDTFVVAAPVEIRDDRYYVGAIVKKDVNSQRFYVHDVLAEKGESKPFKTGAIAGAPGGSDSPSIKRLLQNSMNVKEPPAVSDADIRPQTNTSTTSGGPASGDSITQFTENTRPLGAQVAAEPYQEKTSEFYTNTVKNSPMFTDAEKNMAIAQAPKEQIISEKQSLTEARQRLETDFDGEVNHLNKTPMYTGADVDTAMGVTEAYLKEARQTGDYSKAMDWINQVADRAGESGRSLQALQKYSRTPEGMLVQGTKMINDAAKKALEGKAGLTPTGHKLENALRAIQNALKNPDALSNPETAQKIANILKGDTDTADQIMRLAESGKGSDAIKSVLMQKYAIPSLTDDDMSRITDLMGQYTKATDPAEKNALAVQVCKIIGNRLPVGFFEKVDQWRYTSMLFNMLTNERNVLGNAASYATREWKNVTGIALERALPVEERTKAILTPADKPLREAAEKAYQSVKFDLESTSKLDFRNMISDNRRIYNTRVLEWLRTSSNWLLDKEDDIGLHKVFTSAFAEGMKARKLTPEFLASDAGKSAMQSLQAWASREATRTMFHESSRVAQVLNQLESRSKVGKIFIGGMLPFKQTPIDILKQGARYSPLGLLKGVTYDVAKLRHGDISKLEFIDNLAAGLTGTQLAVVGAWLGSLGLVTTESNASGNAADFQAQQQGYQDYALKIGNKTYTLDWLSPAAMPFFFGAELQKTLFGNESLTTGEKVQQGFGRMLNAMTKVTDPLMNLSMLQSVNDMLNSAKYGVGNAISSTAQDAAQSYVGQYFPSQLGAIARAVTPYKKTSYTSSASPLGKVVEQTGRSAMQKIPGVNLLLPNSIDQWGQPVSSGTPVERILNNFFSPGKLQSAKNDAVNDEVSRLYQSTGDSSALPKTAAGYFTEGGARYDLTSTEKEKYATVLGQTAHDVAAQLIGSGEYADLSDHGKALALSRVYSDAAAKAKKLILDARGVKNSITVGSSKSRNSLYRSIDDWVTD